VDATGSETPQTARTSRAAQTARGTTPHGTTPRDEPSPGAAARLRAARAPHPALQGLLAFAAYLAVFVAGFGLPLVHHLGEPQLRQYWTDPNFYTWAMRWWPYAVTHGLNPLHSGQIGAPGGYDLAWATTTPSVDLVFWPVTALFGVLVSFNVMLLLVPPASALAAFVAARRLTGRFWAALLAGGVYGLTPFELVHDWQGQPNLTMIALPPLLVYLVLLWWDGTLRWPGFVSWTAVLVAVEFYTFTEAFAGLTVVAAGALVLGFLVAGRGARRKAARLAGLSAVGYAGALLLSYPYLRYALRHDPGTLTRQLPAFSLHLVRLILPSSDKLFGLTPLIVYSNHIGRLGIDDYTGIPLLLVPFALAVFARSDKIARLLVIMLVFVLVLAAGPYLVIGNHTPVRLPWAALWNLPFARSAEPSRLIVFASLVLALALARWLAAPVAGRLSRIARWGLGLLAVAVLVADLPTSHSAVNPAPPGSVATAAARPANQLPPFITSGLYRQYLRPGESVVVVTDRGNAGLLFQAATGFYFRIEGGFINDSLTPRQDALPGPVGNLSQYNHARIAEFEDYLRSSGTGAILVEQAWAEPWMSIFGRLGLHGTSAGGVTVYPVGPHAALLPWPKPAS
jgi:hypothetical protein